MVLILIFMLRFLGSLGLFISDNSNRPKWSDLSIWLGLFLCSIIGVLVSSWSGPVMMVAGACIGHVCLRRIEITQLDRITNSEFVTGVSHRETNSVGVMFNCELVKFAEVLVVSISMGKLIDFSAVLFQNRFLIFILIVLCGNTRFFMELWFGIRLETKKDAPVFFKMISILLATFLVSFLQEKWMVGVVGWLSFVGVLVSAVKLERLMEEEVVDDMDLRSFNGRFSRISRESGKELLLNSQLIRKNRSALKLIF